MGMTGIQPPRRLSPEDRVDDFTCGLRIVDTWLHSRAVGAMKGHTATVYVAVDREANNAIAGYYTLSAHSIIREQAPGWLRRNIPDPIPVVLLGMLGVDIRYQTRRIGESLLQNAIARSLDISQVIGARALIVEPATKNVIPFYAKYGFRELRDTDQLALPLY